MVAQKRPARVKAASPNESLRALNWTPGGAPDGFPARFAAEAFVMPQAALLGSGWQLEPQGKRDLLQRLLSTGQKLRSVTQARVSRGLTTGFNDAYVIPEERRLELIGQDPSCAHLFKPFLGGKNVRRWRAAESGRWLIKLPSSENVTHPWSGKDEATAECVFKRTYPAIYEWWLSEGWIAPLRDRYDQGKYYWELRSCTYYESFEETKIISTKISSQPTFALDDSGSYLANTSYFFSAIDASLVCATLNSSLGDYLSKQIFVQKQGGFYEVQPTALEAMPIAGGTPEQEASLALVVAAILAGAQPRAPLEALLNAFVYELFFPDEVAAAGSPFAAARETGLERLAILSGAALARAAEDWSRTLSDPAGPLYHSLFALQALEPVRIIEGRL